MFETYISSGKQKGYGIDREAANETELIFEIHPKFENGVIWKNERKFV